MSEHLLCNCRIIIFLTGIGINQNYILAPAVVKVATFFTANKQIGRNVSCSPGSRSLVLVIIKDIFNQFAQPGMFNGVFFRNKNGDILGSCMRSNENSI